MIISINAKKKAFDKVQQPFVKKKKTQQSGNRKSITQHNKDPMCKTYSQHHTQWAKTRSVSLKIRNMTGVSTFTCYSTWYWKS